MEIRQLQDIDIRRLRVFMAVAEGGGFAAAEAELGVSPATISVRMSELEHTLGVRLCNRGRTGFGLTPDGKTVYEECLRLFVAHEDFRNSVHNLRGLLTGELKIGLIDNIVFDPDCPIAGALAKLMDASTDLKLSVYTMEPLELQRAVIDRRIHLAIGVFYKKVQSLNFVSLFSERLNLYCAAGNALFDAHPDDVTIESIGQQSCVERTYGQTAERLNPGRHLKIDAWSSSLEATAILILSGQYLGFLPTYYADIWERRGQMKILLPDRFHYQSKICIVTRKNQHNNVLVKALSGILRAQQNALREQRE